MAMSRKRTHEEGAEREARLPISLCARPPDPTPARPKWRRTGRTSVIMTDAHKDVLMARRSVLVSTMQLSDDVLNQLISRKRSLCMAGIDEAKRLMSLVMKLDETQAIARNGASESEKVQRLLDILPRKPDQAYVDLVRVLRLDGQDHVANVLEPDASIIKSNYVRLRQLLDLETGALDDLLSREVINQLQYDELSDLPSHRRNEDFLNFIIVHCPQGSFQTVLEVLESCHQKHVVNFILSGGKIDTNSAEERALTDDEVKRVTINQKSFIDLLQPEVIVPKLRELDVITTRHSNAVLCKENDAEKNRKLLEIIKRRSHADVMRFCGVLEGEGMDFLAKAVKGEGVIPILHAKQDARCAKHPRHSAELVAEETEMCASVNGLRSHIVTSEDKERHQYWRDVTKLRERSITLAGVSPTGSIAVYLLCETRQALHDFWSLMQTGVMRGYIERILTGEREQGVEISLSVDPEDCSLMFEYPWAEPSEAGSAAAPLEDQLDAVDILELVRRKDMSVREAERLLRELCDPGGAGAEGDLEPAARRPAMTRARSTECQGLQRACTTRPGWREASPILGASPVLPASFQFHRAVTTPVFGSSGVLKE